MKLEAFQTALNQWGRDRVPFLFLADFEMQCLEAWPLHTLPANLSFAIDAKPSTDLRPVAGSTLGLHPIPYDDYQKKFDFVQRHIQLGHSYLTNLTIKTKIELTESLEDLFVWSRAKYKLCWKDRFLVFSPETFIQIKNEKIYSFPMKGTIDATVSDAEKQILADTKELAEHVTIVDLIRNDLSKFATNVQVDRFRYVEPVVAQQKKLLQVSSQVSGDLPTGYLSELGTILIALLPAGSVSGAPKKRTLEIIREAEAEKRGYYTGVFGCFDGRDLDSAVMIRFIEQDGANFYYRSGGGITAQSVCEKEYQEAIDKIYVPVY